MQPKCQVAGVLRYVNTEDFTIHQQKTLRAIVQCRTSAFGGHVDVCDECGVVHISYNSCRNVSLRPTTFKLIAIKIL